MNLIRAARFFVAVIEEGHFGQAADRLGITQPPLSQGLKRLEETLGVRLVNRSRQGATATEAGALLLPAMRALLAGEAEVLRLAEELATTRQDIQVGVVEPVPAAMTAALVASCVAVSEQDVALRTATTTEIVEDIQRHRLDLGIVEHPSIIGDLFGSDVVLVPRRVLRPALAPCGPAEDIRLLIDRPVATTARAGAPAVHDLLEDTLRARGITHGTVTVPDERAALALVVTDRARILTADWSRPPEGLVAIDLPAGILPARLRVVRRPEERNQAVLRCAEALGEALLADHAAARHD